MIQNQIVITLVAKNKEQKILIVIISQKIIYFLNKKIKKLIKHQPLIWKHKNKK